MVSSNVIQFQLRRDSGVDGIGKSSDASVDGYYQNINSDTTNQIAYPLSFSFEDKPNTTSSVRYEIYMKTDGAGLGYFSDGGGTQFYITEIAQ